MRRYKGEIDLEKKRILMVAPTEMCNAGVPNVIMTLIRQLQDRYTFDVLALSAKEGFFDGEVRQYGGQVFHLSVLDYMDHKILYPYRMLQIKRGLRKILENRHYTAIHCHCGINSGPCLALAKKMGVAHRISTAHGNYLRYGINYILRAMNWCCKRLIVRNATARLACSDLAGKTLYPGADFVNVLNSVDVDYYREVQPVPHEGLNLLQIGYYCTNKNQLFSLKLLHQLRQKGVDARLQLIGFPMEAGYLETLKQYAAEHKLEDSITWLPPDWDKRIALGQSDYSLLPSGSEGFGLVALESQAAGVMCLMSDRVPRDANAGLGVFLPYNDPDAWCDYLLERMHEGKKTDRPDLSHLSHAAYAEKNGEYYES